MISLEALRDLYDYNYWARDRQLDACAKLSEEQLVRPMGGSYGSLRDTLVHLLGGEWVWQERFRGRSPRSLPEWLEEIRKLETIRDRWASVERQMRSCLAGLTATRSPSRSPTQI